MPQDITLSSLTTVRPYRPEHASHVIRHFQPSTNAGSSNRIAYGDVVQLDVNTATNSFRIVKCSTGSSGGVGSTAIVGVALDSDTSDGSTLGLTTRQTIPVAIGLSSAEFRWPSKFTVAQHQSTLVNTDRGVQYDSTLGIFFLGALSPSSNAGGPVNIRITEVLDAGSSNGFVVGRFNSTVVTVTTVR